MSCITYIYAHACLLIREDYTNFIQWCKYEKPENKWFQRSGIDSSDSSKLEVEVTELKQWIWINTCVLFIIFVILLWKM